MATSLEFQRHKRNASIVNFCFMTLTLLITNEIDLAYTYLLNKYNMFASKIPKSLELRYANLMIVVFYCLLKRLEPTKYNI